MDQQHSPRTASEPQNDLAASRRRFWLAREQSVSQSSTQRIRSVLTMRWWPADRERTERANR